MIAIDKSVRKLERYEPHQKYYVGGVEVPGASKIAKIGVDTTGLQIWKDSCRRKGLDPDQIRDEAATIGGIVHFLIQAAIEGFEPDFSDYTNEEVMSAQAPFESAMAWWLNQDLAFVAAEQQLVSQEYRYGGTVDMVCRDGDGDLVLLDWKTSSQIRPEHRYQIAGYEQLVQGNTDGPVMRRAIVRVARDGGKVQRNPWISDEDIEAYWGVFRTQVALYHAIKEAE